MVFDPKTGKTTTGTGTVRGQYFDPRAPEKTGLIHELPDRFKKRLKPVWTPQPDTGEAVPDPGLVPEPEPEEYSSVPTLGATRSRVATGGQESLGGGRGPAFNWAERVARYPGIENVKPPSKKKTKKLTDYFSGPGSKSLSDYNLGWASPSRFGSPRLGGLGYSDKIKNPMAARTRMIMGGRPLFRRWL